MSTPKKEMSEANSSKESRKAQITCPITYQIFSSPLRINNCGHIFEKEALYSHFAKRSKNDSCPCPSCNGAFRIDDCKFDFYMKANVDLFLADYPDEKADVYKPNVGIKFIEKKSEVAFRGNSNVKIDSKAAYEKKQVAQVAVELEAIVLPAIPAIAHLNNNELKELEAKGNLDAKIQHATSLCSEPATLDEGMRLLSEVALTAKNKVPQGLYALGVLSLELLSRLHAFSEEEKIRGIKCLQAAADLEYFPALSMFAQYCRVNPRVVDNDNNLRIKYNEMAAEEGCPQAQSFIGDSYYHGELNFRNITLAKAWYTKAATNGNQNASEMLQLIRKVEQEQNSKLQKPKNVLSLFAPAPMRSASTSSVTTMSSISLSESISSSPFAPTPMTSASTSSVTTMSSTALSSKYGTIAIKPFDTNKDISCDIELLEKLRDIKIGSEGKPSVNAVVRLGLDKYFGCHTSADQIEGAYLIAKAVPSEEKKEEKKVAELLAVTAPTADLAAEVCARGFCYATGYNNYNQDQKKALEYYKIAAGWRYAPAQMILAKCYYEQKDYLEAVRYFKKAASSGNAIAQYDLGYCYENGDGVPRDFSNALVYYRLAAAQGSVAAHEKIWSFLQNEATADVSKFLAQIYSFAAESNERYARNINDKVICGVCYFFGRGVEKDIGTALSMWATAAMKGSLIAQRYLHDNEHLIQSLKETSAELTKWQQTQHSSSQEMKSNSMA